MTVKRYNMHVDTSGDPVAIAALHGEWVRCEDYEELQKHVGRLVESALDTHDIGLSKMLDDYEDPEPPTAPDILEAGAKHMRDRARLYDQPGGERSMTHAVGVFEALTGITLTAQDGWLFMVILKLVRAQKNPDHMDNYEDACAYVALLAEEQAGDV